MQPSWIVALHTDTLALRSVVELPTMRQLVRMDQSMADQIKCDLEQKEKYVVYKYHIHAHA